MTLTLFQFAECRGEGADRGLRDGVHPPVGERLREERVGKLRCDLGLHGLPLPVRPGSLGLMPLLQLDLQHVAAAVLVLQVLRRAQAPVEHKLIWHLWCVHLSMSIMNEMLISQKQNTFIWQIFLPEFALDHDSYAVAEGVGLLHRMRGQNGAAVLLQNRIRRLVNADGTDGDIYN